MQAVCAPLFVYLEVNQFTWIRHFANGARRCYLTTHVGSLRTLYALKLHDLLLEPSFGIGMRHLYVAVGSLQALVIVEVIPTGDQNFYILRLDEKNLHYQHKAMQHSDLVNHFIVYFKQNNQFMLDRHRQCTLDLPIMLSLPLAQASWIAQFMQATKLTYYQLEYQSGDRVKISCREADCAVLLASGLSIARVATKLYISPHTVKTHVKNLKDKLNCQRMQQALDVLNTQGILESHARQMAISQVA